MAGRALLPLLVVLCLHVAQVGSVAGRDPSGGDALARAEEHHRAGRHEAALAELARAAAELPQSPRPRVAMATVLLAARREREAVQMLREAAELHRQQPHLGGGPHEEGFGGATRAAVLANLATWLYQTGDAAGATDACEEALAVQPLHARCFYIHGVSMLSSGRWRDGGGLSAARGSLSAAVRLFRTAEERSNALFALGSLQLRAGQMAPAASAFEAALRLAPDRSDVLMRVGEMRSRFAQHAAALEAFRAAEGLRPDHADATIQCGNALRRLKKLTKALAKYREAAGAPGATQWDKAEAHYWIGSVREMQGKKGNAEKAYLQALAADPGHARALNNLGSMLMARNDPVMPCSSSVHPSGFCYVV
jgi:tetratricopeptide (TPR) repeat protein